jgi:predicted permease
MSMALLVPAGLFAKSLFNISRVDLGIQTDHMMLFSIAPELNSYTTERTRQLFERMEDELAAVPGVTSVVATIVPVLAGDNWGNSLGVEGFEAGPDTNTNASFNGVGPGYFKTMGVPLMMGREFTRSDAFGTPKVAIVNQAFVKKFNLGDNPLGKRFGLGGGAGTKMDIEIVGVAQDAKYSDVKDAVPPQYYLPYRQEERLGYGYFYVRTATPPEQMLSTIPAVMRKLDASLPLGDVKTMETQIAENVTQDRIISTLSLSFAVLATILAAIGLYGVLAYTVAQRTREFGLRMALGADGSAVRGMVMKQVAMMAAIGGLIGLAAAIGIGRLAQSLLFEMEGTDPFVLAGATFALAVVAIGAGFIPALRASRIDPMNALRYE